MRLSVIYIYISRDRGEERHGQGGEKSISELMHMYGMVYIHWHAPSIVKVDMLFPSHYQVAFLIRIG